MWEYINPNHDAHPMHVHLVNFQVLNRQPIDAAAYQKDYDKWIYGGRKPKDHRCWPTTSPAHRFRRTRTKRCPTRTRSRPLRRW
ncbi:multicopper oxidase domain-containing protein [Streptomyces sp. NPDC007095]|uniref:multicopper oxidase domain-containing protein n=1 Tax=Streptomyces sp. NPDC007095 TaxID=3154482 RepID=UPI0033E03578